jgi:hypothetical protein
VPLNLEAAQTLARGPFNPYIIKPEWLVSNRVCEDDEVEIRFSPLSQGVAFSLKEVKWEIDFRHLSVESLKSNCGELVAQVIDLLPHTPIRAIANNFNYACSKEEWGSSPLPMLGKSAAGPFSGLGQVEQTRWVCVSKVDGVKVDVTVADDESGVAVLFNFSRETKDAEESRAAAMRFEQDKQWSAALLRQLVAQEVST